MNKAASHRFAINHPISNFCIDIFLFLTTNLTNPRFDIFSPVRVRTAGTSLCWFVVEIFKKSEFHQAKMNVRGKK